MQSMKRSSAATLIVGSSMGNVTRRRICQYEAPSTRAASNGSLGSPARPAITISVINGVHSQISTSASDGITLAEPAIQSGSGKFSSSSTKLITPAVGSNISSQTMATATGVAIIGSSKMDVTIRLPG